MPFKLNLDADGVFFGSTPIDPAAVQPGDVVLDHAPDNPPGCYRWMPEANGVPAHLQPLPKEQQKTAPGAPTLEQAFADYLTNGSTGARVSAWAAWFKTTPAAQVPGTTGA